MQAPKQRMPTIVSTITKCVSSATWKADWPLPSPYSKQQGKMSEQGAEKIEKGDEVFALHTVNQCPLTTTKNNSWMQGQE